MADMATIEARQYVVADRLPYVPPWARRLRERVLQRVANGASIRRVAEDEKLDPLAVARWVHGPDVTHVANDPEVADAVREGIALVRDGASYDAAAAAVGISAATLMQRCWHERTPSSHRDDQSQYTAIRRDRNLRLARAREMATRWIKGDVMYTELAPEYGISPVRCSDEIRDYLHRRRAFADVPREHGPWR